MLFPLSQPSPSKGEIDARVALEDVSAYAELTSWEGRHPTLLDTVPVWLVLAPIRLARGLWWHARFQILFGILGREPPPGSVEADFATWQALQDEPHTRLSYPKWASIEEHKRAELVEKRLWVTANMKAWKRDMTVAKKKTW